MLAPLYVRVLPFLATKPFTYVTFKPVTRLHSAGRANFVSLKGFHHGLRFSFMPFPRVDFCCQDKKKSVETCLIRPAPEPAIRTARGSAMGDRIAPIPCRTTAVGEPEARSALDGSLYSLRWIISTTRSRVFGPKPLATIFGRLKSFSM